MCTNINNYVPIRGWFDDEGEEEKWGYGYREDMIAQYKQALYHKNFTLQGQGKDDPIDTLENRIKFWLNNFNKDEGLFPDHLNDSDYNNEGLERSVQSAEIVPDRRELKKFLDILRSN